MSKLYFKYGCMGCGKSAQALMCRFNYIKNGFSVFFAKPSIDTRDGAFVKTRIGLSAPCVLFDKKENLIELVGACKDRVDVVIVDEAQFCTAEQIEQLKEISLKVPVLCYGLKTDFKGFLFDGSKRLFELSDSLMEIKSVCKCGAKATMNAKIVDGVVVTSGDVVNIGGDEKYEGMCFNCWKKKQRGEV